MVSFDNVYLPLMGIVTIIVNIVTIINLNLSFWAMLGIVTIISQQFW